MFNWLSGASIVLFPEDILKKKDMATVRFGEAYLPHSCFHCSQNAWDNTGSRRTSCFTRWVYFIHEDINLCKNKQSNKNRPIF